MAINTIDDTEQVANRMGTFGLNNAIQEELTDSDDDTTQEQDQEIEAEGDDTEKTDKESDERGSVDASDDDGDKETGSEDEEVEDSDDGGSDGDGEPNPEMVALNEKIDRLTQSERAWQSRYDQLIASQNKPRAAEIKHDEDEFGDLDDEELVTGADIKASAKRSNSRKMQAEVNEDVEADKAREQAWLNSRPDTQQVIDYYHANNLATDPDIIGQTTATGIYSAVKLKMAEKSMDEKVKVAVDKEIASQRKKLVKGKGKGKVPPTGGGGARKKGAGGRGLDPISSSERQYLSFFGPDARIENPKR